jgi:hypothetical protein
MQAMQSNTPRGGTPDTRVFGAMVPGTADDGERIPTPHKRTSASCQDALSQRTLAKIICHHSTTVRWMNGEHDDMLKLIVE